MAHKKNKEEKKSRDNNRNKSKKRNAVLAGFSEEHQEHMESVNSNTELHADDVDFDKNPDKNHYLGDSDTEDTPKKKKKQHLPAESSDKKGKKSIRQMKREKFAQRQAEAESIAKEQLKSQCLSYLSQWKHDKQSWKFMKAKQVWLYKNKFSANLVPDSSWPLFLEYFESAKGNIRNMLLNDANKIIMQMDDWTESQNEKDKGEENDTETMKEIKKPDETSYKRARDLIQCLQE